MPVAIDPNQQISEETTKFRYITPIIEEKWGNREKILMEY